MKSLLLFAILALSINAFAQNDQPPFNLQRPTSSSREILQEITENTGKQRSGIISEIISRQTSKHQKVKQSSLIQIYDSLYNWFWDSPSSGWNLAFKFTDIVYDENNNMISEIEQYRNDTAWMNYLHYTYTYDASNNLTSESYYDRNDSVWLKDLQFIYTYDAENFTTSTSYKRWDEAGTEIIESDSTHYYFHTVGINEMPESFESISIYPNPSTTSITIELPNTTPVNNTTLSIYNVNAQQVISRRITEPLTVIDISTLPRGVYFARITTDAKVMVGKFIKQ